MDISKLKIGDWVCITPDETEHPIYGRIQGFTDDCVIIDNDIMGPENISPITANDKMYELFRRTNDINSIIDILNDAYNKLKDFYQRGKMSNGFMPAKYSKIGDIIYDIGDTIDDLKLFINE